MAYLSQLKDRHLYRALLARDARFDGVVFIGVTSTRVYCRPVCPAVKPRRDRCRYFASAAAAERAGYRPCLRCRPELAPGLPDFRDHAGAAAVSSTESVERIAQLAARRIAGGALDGAGVDDLAAVLGVTARHLRRCLRRTFGATPLEMAVTRRLLMAKQLLTDTDLGITGVAFASGFGSVRRFNALFRNRYRMTPSAMRRPARGGHDETAPDGLAEANGLSLSLGYRAPYDWSAMSAYLATRAIPGVEVVTADGRYRRTVRVGGRRGHIAVGADQPRGGRAAGLPRSATLRLEVSASLIPALIPLVARVRRLFDLDADPQAVADDLARDPVLRPYVERRPGLRLPGAVDGFELALRAVLGQQVTVRGASTLAGRLVQLVGEPLPAALSFEGAQAVSVSHFPPSADRIADASLASLVAIGLPRARAACIWELARAVAHGELPELTGDAPLADPSMLVRQLLAIPGIGQWTATYVAMRVCHWPDAFPEGDLGLRRAMGGLSAARLRAVAEAWRPWRAYAAQHLWAGLAAAPPDSAGTG